MNVEGWSIHLSQVMRSYHITINYGSMTDHSLMSLIISVLVLVPSHVSRSIHNILPASDSLALARVIEALLMRTGVLGRVR